MLHPLYYSQILKVNSFKKFSRINEMEDDQLLLSLMQVFIAQMDSALKISNIISEHSNEEEMSPDSLVTGLVYRLMISMDDKEMKESALHLIEENVEKMESPLHKLEHRLHPIVAYFIMPIFAFSNAGVVLSAEQFDAAFSSSLTLGILFGLFVGKQAGIMITIYISSKLGIIKLPNTEKVWTIFYGIALLTGIGFTMSLFISGLAFSDAQSIEYSKVGIFVGSLLSGLIGYLFLRYRLSPDTAND